MKQIDMINSRHIVIIAGFAHKQTQLTGLSTPHTAQHEHRQHALTRAVRSPTAGGRRVQGTHTAHTLLYTFMWAGREST
jgi:hypothetical protein